MKRNQAISSAKPFDQKGIISTNPLFVDQGVSSVPVLSHEEKQNILKIADLLEHLRYDESQDEESL